MNFLLFVIVLAELVSCSSDHSIIVWENLGEIWTEKSRLGTVGGLIPGGFGAKFNETTVVTWGFQGSIQIWLDVDVRSRK